MSKLIIFVSTYLYAQNHSKRTIILKVMWSYLKKAFNSQSYRQ